MADGDKPTPESVASTIARALLKLPPPEKKRRKKPKRRAKQPTSR